jgi:hypothetical protein
MGKLIKTLLILLFAVSSYSQTIIGELKFGGVLSVGLYQHDNYFNLMYQDDQFRHIREYKSFNLLEDEKETLYELLTATKEPNATEEITLKSGDIILILYKKQYVVMSHINKYGIKGYCRMNLKQVKKVFNIN